jgi:hypothetical protein
MATPTTEEAKAMCALLDDFARASAEAEDYTRSVASRRQAQRDQVELRARIVTLMLRGGGAA